MKGWMDGIQNEYNGEKYKALTLIQVQRLPDIGFELVYYLPHSPLAISEEDIKDMCTPVKRAQRLMLMIVIQTMTTSLVTARAMQSEKA